ncbi:protein phosphatase 2C 21 [Asbolus verrucosus]|uniref:protein-serine/threonine phosphatase n=1 Tax=Asbolus verrucosus TaxID=1661398 RepID=A0A482VGN6_ASBVE|nr:protein phosphatase 2C 21 [Asbolus verrucosus]
MGSYLSEPVTEKESTDESNDKLICGASSMQGWRVSQEDAHNCLLYFDTNTSLFAVYDGHGGQEVAQYCSQKLPDFIKNTLEYKEGKIDEALISGFLGFDALIATPEVVEVLKEMAGDKEEAEESDEEENVNNLYEEAAMPIEQVIEKYTSNLLNPAVRNLKKDVDKFPKSPYLKAKKESDSTVGTSAGSCSSSSTSQIFDKCGDGVSSSSEAETNDKNGNESETKETNGPQDVPEIKISVPDSSDMKEAVAASTLSGKTTESPTQNGEISTPDSEALAKGDVSSSSAPVENGAVSKKGKGKAVIKPEAVKTPINTRPKRNAQQLYKEWLDFGEDSEDSDEEDQTFEGPNEESSEDDADGVNVSIDVDASEEESSEEEEENEEELEDEDEEGLAFARNMKEEPGSDSGCTAVVALLQGNELYVANAGDSRCIVCRNGKAIEMSFDHKPEDEPERERIVKAGGRVTSDGRVNGGLNLSRAIGDHAYKQNKELSDREQMITALPDVKKLTINPNEDEFMVLACDGIWNFMSSQEVVDFVRPSILEGREKLSQICEEMFDHCLAPNTMGDGTGCDNMTAIIVKFKSNILKRAASPPQLEENDTKRAKTDAESEAQIDTTV